MVLGQGKAFAAIPVSLQPEAIITKVHFPARRRACVGSAPSQP